MLKLPPLSLYIHFPWCVKKCPYCDFNSHALREKIPDDNYLKHLIGDLQMHETDMQGRQFKSIFLGGGTPSLFPSRTLGQIFEYLVQKQLISDNSEITLEVNPGTVERGLFKDYQAMGINRISLGVQSFQDTKLKKLGRIHCQKEIYLAVEQIIESGINNFNIDLMHGLPSQSIDDALFDLSQAIELNPTHISWYQLTIEPNTSFARCPPELPNESILESIETYGKSLLEENKFQQYEVSAYARNNLISTHNMNYWQFGDYIGIGAGAHSKITNSKENIIKRHWKIKHPKFYMQSAHYRSGTEVIERDQRVYEFVLNALRLTSGFSYDLFESRTGLDRNVLKMAIDKALEFQLIETNENYLIPNKRGKLYLNNLINLFSE
ncbi:radical SAM family heme chaperone HemW [Thiotrichales bacterium 19S3-7]|nr:radical SAM family heme chaperone HemW [Thiotrichales bacterium 19S3-7]MCF6801235.1 radical SAM family heme chaperone HemW [Thiotrichales bacterium 19S3-11]